MATDQHSTRLVDRAQNQHCQHPRPVYRHPRPLGIFSKGSSSTPKSTVRRDCCLFCAPSFLHRSAVTTATWRMDTTSSRSSGDDTVFTNLVHKRAEKVFCRQNARPHVNMSEEGASSIVPQGLQLYAPESSTTNVAARREPLPMARNETCYGAGTQERENAQHPDVADLTSQKEKLHNADAGSADTDK